LTLGIACAKINKAKDQMRRVQRDFAAQLAVSKKLMDRMFYFDSLKKTAATLTHEAAGLLETTKKLENSLGDAKRELEQDFSSAEIESNLEEAEIDPIFVLDYAEKLWESIDRVKQICIVTVKDCVARKKRL